MTVRDSVYLVIYLMILLVCPGIAHMLTGWDYSIGWLGGMLSTVLIFHREHYNRVHQPQP